MRSMKKKVLIIIISIIIAVTITAILVAKVQNNYNDKKAFEGKYTLESVTANDLTLEEKIAQMLIVGYTSDYVDNTLSNIIIKNQPGGFIVQGENFTTYEKTKEFVEKINSYTAIPLFMCVDQEGGNVQRIKYMSDKTLDIPSAETVGKTNDKEYAYNIGKIIAEQSRSLGLNTVFAPVMDIKGKTTEDRAFSSDPNKVFEMASSIGKGIESQGVISVYKHFPGIGSAKIDTHDGVSIIDKSKEELLKSDALPFIKQMGSIDMIMLGHSTYPKLSDKPASISKEIITDFLRNELGYNGVVMIDAINMKALSDNYTEEEIYKYGIEAGVDLFIMPSNSTNAINIITELVSKDPTLENKINESVTRILNLKKKKLSNFTSYSKDYFYNEEQVRIIERK